MIAMMIFYDDDIDGRDDVVDDLRSYSGRFIVDNVGDELLCC